MRILAIDFDGTIVEDRFPEIGNMIPGAKENINKFVDDGYVVIIWTCRTHIRLLEAIEWLAKNGIKYHHINASSPINVAMHKGIDTRKVFADMYIDDKGLMHPLPHWDEIYEMVIDRIPCNYGDLVAKEGFL